MPTQGASNVIAAVKRETTTGVAAASGAGATQLRIIPSPGLRLQRNEIRSQEKRDDLIRQIGRLGGISVGGTYNAEITIGGFTDMALESILRSTFAASFTTDQTTATSITTTANTIARAAGSWLTEGYRVGDVVTLTNHQPTTNNNQRMIVTGVTAMTLTVAGSPLTLNASPDTNFSLTRLKKVRTSSNLQRHSYTIEQYDEDIDQAELFLGCRLTGVAISLRPNAIASIVYTFMGMDRTIIEAVAAPYFTSPDLSTGRPLIADDSIIAHDGTVITKFTGLDINLQIAAAGQPVIGSFVTPDIYDNELSVTGQMTGVREDFSRLTQYDNEEEFEIGVILREPGVDPVNAMGIYLPRVMFTDLDAPFLGDEGPKIETLPFTAGPKETTTGYDATVISFSSTAA